MNRRDFFRRTVGAAISGLLAPLLPRAKPYNYDELQRKGTRWIIPIIYRRPVISPLISRALNNTISGAVFGSENKWANGDIL